MKRAAHDPMIDEAGMASDPYFADDHWDDEDQWVDNDDVDDGMWDSQADRAVTMITRYLDGDLTIQEVGEMHHRLAADPEFRQKAQPFIYDWCGVDINELPGSELVAALSKVYAQVWEQVAVGNGDPG